MGKIKEIHFGEYKNKACNKRKRRSIYFAIIVFKKAADAELVTRDSKLLQNIVNKTMKKSVKYVAFDGDEDSDDNQEKTPQDEHRRIMEEGGFTIVEEGAQNMTSKKHKVSDGMVTTMHGITQEEGMRIYREQLKRGMSI